ncbi:uncharacterized protein LOC26529988 [Drosophila willistoni]|uniref:uncharacterized protein LOC26529988 n=1 Tax=Drosophila willistoni TaxID=7260 RepID=UPI001F079492|nr:uncharacterized protein LOC26529988 [Drosophila willistoni]
MQSTIAVLGRDIVGITFHNSIAAYSVFQLLWLKTAIKKLTLINEYNWNDLDKTRIIYDLPFIEQLHVVETPIWDTADELWDMIATCPRLEVLYISGQQTDKWFFSWDRELMHYVLKTRARPLSLYFHHLEPHKKLIRHYFQHANLKLSFEAVEIEYIRNRYTKVEFLPQEISKFR